ncbi:MULTISPECIES: decaprenyl-phosphate phosphoribosyltransferase [Kyrpidia]|uniref:Decaprenyl-phosphate phosphoribosyltransferase n=1 Tax=Kyrpidia spormannii TaxID=2055160 RepID=A0A6F9EE44_9BACL|nr:MULTISPECIES: decaprenyl-phosphate phosphoribosyltransferase [Kyrpidia]MCL6575460.1 decaprenyl-phosphate phosphoribosyltransferase [Kyrpidia sp.]CAB3394574.1 Decaprenyl-phosphate phosphoribosyltransferase [Kyrpidia spormannii]HHY65635.1 decaprenyl-phosphate phosphoribosyltransferase [Alicyclobacillus sp.]
MERDTHRRAISAMGSDLWTLMRPRQWMKNVFVLAPVFFAGKIGNWGSLWATVAATVAFCLMSSAVYVVNDFMDMDRDRAHPKKKHRPLASGRVSPGPAVVLAAALFVVAEWLGWVADTGAGVPTVLLIYGLMNLLYSTVLKHYAIVDVLIIAFGFVLRVVAGAFAAEVPPSPWLLLTTFLLASVLGLCKRRAELAALEDQAAVHRANLGVYTVDLLNQLISISTAATIMTYAMYTFSGPQGPRAMVTVPFVMYGLFRYLYLVNQKNEGENPDQIVVRDTPFVINGLLWVGASFAVVYWPWL